MRILYVATDQPVPGATGGSVHVVEVAEGLARRGHEVHVLGRAGPGPAGTAAFRFHEARALLPHRLFRWTARRQVETLIDAHGIELVIERYYNFGGEGIFAAARKGIASVLEVNAPVVDHPGSAKAWIDRALLVRPLRRWRASLCRRADAIVTPLPAIVPADVPPGKVHALAWGANVERFRPGAVPPRSYGLGAGATIAVFSGSFRRWHGADVAVRALRRAIGREGGGSLGLVLLGDGPERRRVAREIARAGLGDRVRLVGAVPYEEMPSALAGAHIGLAPFQPSRHRQLRLGFYWSPLKVFEYMAMALPVVTLDVEPLRRIVRPGREGLLVPEGDEEALAAAILALARDPALAAAMGRAGRERVVTHFSWQRHCERLDAILHAARAAAEARRAAR